MHPKAATDLDRAVGLRITAHRKAKGLSQTALGQAIGVTFQQVQKYEKGANRVGASRLQAIAQALHVPLSALFADEGGGEPDASGQVLTLLAEAGAMSLLQAYAAIEDAQLRRDVLAIVHSMARIRMGGVAGTA
jgi:transcriptional regulator with XRE-family HTH domain